MYLGMVRILESNCVQRDATDSPEKVKSCIHRNAKNSPEKLDSCLQCNATDSLEEVDVCVAGNATDSTEKHAALYTNFLVMMMDSIFLIPMFLIISESTMCKDSQIRWYYWVT